MNTTTLTNVFESHKEALVDKLNGLSLPSDAQKVQEVIAVFLNSLFESDGVYRQNLIQSEDYILQAALQLLQAQQNITAEIVASSKAGKTAINESEMPESRKGNKFIPVLGAGVGAGVGAIAGSFLGEWGIICGAIAGTAVAIYCDTKFTKPSERNRSKASTEAPVIDVEILSNIVGKVCESIDKLMETYRVQVKRIENLYTQIDKPSLLNECSALFAQVANVYKAVEANKENTPPKVVSATEMLVESLENYGLTIKDGKVVNE